MTTEELEQLGKLIETKLEAEREQTRKIIREETVSKEDLKASEERLMKKIADSQEDTIEVLKELIHTGYQMHEERIEALEKHTGIHDPNKN